MEFDKSRIYSAVNADELRAGDKVIVANTLGTLKRNVANNVKPLILLEVIDEDYDLRFEVNFNKGRYALAYLVERKENCTNCENLLSSTEGECSCKISPRFVEYRTKPIDVIKCENYTPKTEPKASEICINCEYYSTGYCNKHDKPTRYDNTCPDYLLNKPKTGQMCLNCKHYNKVNDFRDCTLVDNPTGACPHYEAEKHYRPFKDTDELIKVWDAKIGTPNWGTDGDLTMPHIWVRHKATKRTDLIVALTYTSYATVYAEGNLENLFNIYEFLDGTPCGVEE